MRSGGHQPAPADSLDQQILDVELRLMQRRRSSRQHGAALRQRLRDTLSSPLMLLVAAGVGFALGPWSWRRKAAPSVAQGAGGGPSLLSTIMKALTLAGAVMAILPAAKTPKRPGQ